MGVGETLSDKIIRERDEPLWGACIRHFGSVRVASHAAGAVYVKESNCSPKTINIPTRNMEYAYFIGVLLGDGYIVRRRGVYVGVNCESEDLDMVRAFGEIGKRHFGLKYSYSSRIRNFKTRVEHHRVHFHSVSMARYLYGETEGKRAIPSWIMSGGRDVISGFISGFFDSDGTVSRLVVGRRKVAYGISFVQYRIKILSDLLTLLSRLGVRANIRRRTVKGYLLDVTSMSNRVKLSNIINSRISRKARRLETLRDYRFFPRRDKPYKSGVLSVVPRVDI
jgi:intein/homing endonuclease